MKTMEIGTRAKDSERLSFRRLKCVVWILLLVYSEGIVRIKVVCPLFGLCHPLINRIRMAASIINHALQYPEHWKEKAPHRRRWTKKKKKTHERNKLMIFWNNYLFSNVNVFLLPFFHPTMFAVIVYFSNR